VVIAAERVAIWEVGDERWARLSGRSAVFQGVEGVRASAAVLRIQPDGPLERGRYRLDLFAEGLIPAGAAAPASAAGRLARFEGVETIEIRPPFGGRPITQLNRPPDADPLYQRALRAFQPRLVETKPRRAEAPRRADSAPAPPAITLSLPADNGAAASPEGRGPDPALRATGFQEEAASEATNPERGDEEVDIQGVLDQIVPGGSPPDVSDPAPPPAPAPGGSPFSEPRETQFEQDEPPPDLEDALGDLPSLEPFAEEDLPDPLEEDLPDSRPVADPLEDIPLMPGSQRIVNIFPLNPGSIRIKGLPRLEDGTETTVISGGVQVVVDDPRLGIVDITADRAVLWTRREGGGGGPLQLGSTAQSSDDPLEIYLEGNVRFLQDRRELAGQEDRVSYEAERFYANLRTERFHALDAELRQFAPGLLAPLRTSAESIFQFKDLEVGPDGEPIPGLATIRASKAVTTGSRFVNPGYRIRSRTIDFFELPEGSGRAGFRRQLLNSGSAPSDDPIYLVDARNNTFFLGPVPFFWMPRFLTTTEDLDPPLRQVSVRSNNLFGQMLLTDWDGFKLLGLRQPDLVDDWNLDLDYLSDRGFAAGSEFGYFGRDFSSDFFGYDLFPNISANHFGYLDLWGLRDFGEDNLGEGPAVITNGPPGAGRAGFTRRSVPPFEDFRGRVLFRHMQSLHPDDDDPLNDTRVQFEAAYISDRHFLEQYFKRVFDTGMDQATRIYAIRQWRNRALTATTEANLLDWYTDSQWIPKIDYYRFGDAPLNLGRFFSYFHHSGVSFANTHTAVEVNNPDVFAFLPNDPTSLTSAPFRTGRLYTNHEVNLPLQFRSLRVVPYAQGQLIGWDNQFNRPLPSIGFAPGLPQQAFIRGGQGSTIGRAWGAFGARADISMSRIFPGVRSDLLNVNGLAHKVNFFADYRDAYSTLDLNRIGVQDDIDDNTTEFVRRFFAMSQFNQGVLPAQFSPILLSLRRGDSPIAGTIDIQDRIETLRFGVNQRLQTKRGPVDDQRIIDYMIFDIWTTFFPDASRDNFGKPFGQTQYRYEWYLGDRTSLVSSGWFDYFDIFGDPIQSTDFDTDGISVITGGVELNRPPRGTAFLGYTVMESGPIHSSALNTSYGYWLSPKWYGTFGGLYDFGESQLISTSFTVTRIGADFLTSIGFTVTPLQDNFSVVFELVPRFSPRTRIGSSGAAMFRPDLRFAPFQ